jgi:6-phosphogluconolactonase
MATPEWKDKFDWARTALFWGDERYVPSDHPDNNYAMVKRELLSKVSVPERNIHRVMTETGTAEDVAAAYEKTVRRVLTSANKNLAQANVPSFDIVLLGLGTNGHTASLFPQTAVLHETTRLVAACYVEEVGSHRITMTTPLLNNAQNIFFLVSGAEKAEVLNSVLYGPRQTEVLPAQLISPNHGSLVWMTDKPAAKLLSERS